MKTRKKPIKCPYCGHTAVLRDASYVYGENAVEEHLYVCTLANGDLRHKRIETHKVFSKLWDTGIMTKKQAYRWLRYIFGLSSEQAHIGQFSEYRCDELIRICRNVLQNNRLAG